MEPIGLPRHEPKSGRAIPAIVLVMVSLAVGGLLGYVGRGHVGGSSAAMRHDTGEQVAAQKTLYTCGMHPEVVQDRPGYCPKCAMKLVPMDPDRARTILQARGESVPAAPGAAGGKERKILYWRSSMDPTYIRNEPGKDPMGMDLVAVYEDEVAGGPTIKIDPVTEQNMGFRYDVVRVGPLEKTVRTVGMVDYDEQGLATVTTKTDGWVEKVHVDRTGTQVHKGDALFEFYSPQLFSAQEEYLVAQRDGKRAQEQGQADLARMTESRRRSARDRLRLFDISDEQIEALERGQNIRKTLTMTAQRTGIVTQKNIVEGDYLTAGSPAYKIADLSTVWVIGKVFESDISYIRLGQEAQMKLDYLPGRVYRGRVTYIYPYLEKGTREIPVRMEFHNPGYDLKPGMYATIEIRSRLAEQAVLIPAMAVLDTGERQIAYVVREAGKFEPRRLKTGVRTDSDELQVVSGLAPGERVVVSGQFMLDSESRLREATLKMLNPGMVNTAQVLEGGAAAAAGHEGMAHGVEPGAKPAEAGPSRYVCPMPSHAGVLHDQPGKCPLCGMQMVPAQPWQKEGGKIAYYTCPMPEDSEVKEAKPGKCPKCGMTLIPVTDEDLKRFEQVKAEQRPPTLYTCPMPVHADVVSDKPGDCPKCGMKLVPAASVAHGKEAEAKWSKDHPTTGSKGNE